MVVVCLYQQELHFRPRPNNQIVESTILSMTNSSKNFYNKVNKI